MMPFCEYRKCKKVASDKVRLLRMWDTYSTYNSNHAQEIWLCDKHLKKVNKMLNVESSKKGK